MSRMIRLNIAPATETHCGTSWASNRCPRIRFLEEFALCGVFNRRLEYPDDGLPERLPACIAAEVRAEGRNS